MTAAQRPVPFSTGFHDSSWGAQGLLNLDISSDLLSATSSTTLEPSDETESLRLLPSSHSQSVGAPALNRFYAPNIGLTLLGITLLLGALAMSSVLWQAMSPSRGVFQSPSLVANVSPMGLAAVAEKPASPTAALQLPDTNQLLVEAQAKARLDYGRDDPFSPLVSPELPTSSDTTEALPPPPAPLVFVGIIEGASGSNRLVAILKTTGESPTTYIKEPGDRFVVDGRRIILKRLTKREATVVVDGLPETLPLQEYSDKMVGQNTSAPAGTPSSAPVLPNPVSSRTPPRNFPFRPQIPPQVPPQVPTTGRG